jgi:hypothetical protein
MHTKELCRAHNERGETVAVVMEDDAGKVLMFGDAAAGKKAMEAAGRYATKMATAGEEDGSTRSSKPFGG